MTRSVFQEVPSLSQIADLALPEGAVPAGTAPVVTVRAAPQHPSNAVLVQMRRDGGPATFLRAMPEGALSQEGQQWYQAPLPAVDEGRRVDYRIELIRAGQRLATLPADGSWLTVTGQPVLVPASAEQIPAQSAPALSSGTPLWAYGLSFFATLIVNLQAEVLGETAEGYRINFYVRDGRVVGPGIDAVVRSEGGDWMAIRPDGIGMVNILITYETADKALILERAGGVFDLGPGGYAKVVAGQLTGSPPFYATPTWSTAHPNWKWLNRCQGFGIGRVVLEKLQVQCDIYIPEVGDRRSDG
ncbi:MAG TPA: DUF3237 family protein [Pseudonocardiaceae bacterium]|nr:DUF3237 family protein [Pseudonocardiaceae bacterium]